MCIYIKSVISKCSSRVLIHKIGSMSYLGKPLPKIGTVKCFHWTFNVHFTSIFNYYEYIHSSHSVLWKLRLKKKNSIPSITVNILEQILSIQWKEIYNFAFPNMSFHSGINQSDTHILIAVLNIQNSLILFLRDRNKNSFVPYILNAEENVLVKIFLESLWLC
jgi:hypothetical protein